MSLKEKAKNFRKLERVLVQAFGEKFIIHELSGRERDALDIFRAKLRKEKGDDYAKQTFTATWVIFTAHDEEGNRAWDENKDIDEVACLASKELRRLYKVAERINGLGEDADEEEENAGN